MMCHLEIIWKNLFNIILLQFLWLTYLKKIIKNYIYKASGIIFEFFFSFLQISSLKYGRLRNWDYFKPKSRLVISSAGDLLLTVVIQTVDYSSARGSQGPLSNFEVLKRFRATNWLFIIQYNCQDEIVFFFSFFCQTREQSQDEIVIMVVKRVVVLKSLSHS